MPNRAETALLLGSRKVMLPEIYRIITIITTCKPTKRVLTVLNHLQNILIVLKVYLLPLPSPKRGLHIISKLPTSNLQKRRCYFACSTSCRLYYDVTQKIFILDIIITYAGH